MESLSKLVVLASTTVAVILQAHLVSRGWPDPLGVLLVGAAFVAARRWPGPVQGVIVAFGYVAAGVWLLALGRFQWYDLVVWLACVLVAIQAGAGLRWSIPAPWRLPLVAWALLLAVAWPLVVLREIDFSFGLLSNYGLPNTGVGVSPPEVALVILHFVLVQMAGLLWFDWLCRTYAGERRPQFERHVLLPMGAAALAACLVAMYQGLVDIHWLGGGGFPELGRAGGTMVDANAFGMMAALWAPVFLAGGVMAANRLNSRVPLWVGGVGLLTASGGVWMSASRTGLLALAIGMTGIAVAVVRGRSAVAPRGVRPFVSGAALAMALLLCAVLVFVPSTGPAARLGENLPPLSVDGVQRLASALWDRGWYGPAADLMIRDHPFAGVGTGAYYTLVEQYTALAGRRSTFDNAQNWYRHQLAELGLIGSLPWILWAILFAGFLFRTRGEEEQRLPAAAVKGTLVALGIASLFGVPAQNPAVALTFWTFAFWYLQLVNPTPVVRASRLVPVPVARAFTPELTCVDGGAGLQACRDGPLVSRTRLAWAGVLALVLVHAAGTLHVAFGDLRVPYRAARGGWRYAYGIEDSREVGFADDHRWTARRAVVNVPYPRGMGLGRQRLKLSAWLEHPDAAEDPVEAKIWTYGRELVLDAKRWDGSAITLFVDIPDRHGALVVETWVNRTWRAPDAENVEISDRGMALAWEWVVTPPAQAGRE